MNGQKKTLIDVTNIQTVRALHVYLAYRLDLPEYYGGNLDALYDILSERNETVMLKGEAASTEMAEYLPKLARMLEDLEG